MVLELSLFPKIINNILLFWNLKFEFVKLEFLEKMYLEKFWKFFFMILVFHRKLDFTTLKYLKNSKFLYIFSKQ